MQLQKKSYDTIVSLYSANIRFKHIAEQRYIKKKKNVNSYNKYSMH